MPEENIMAKVSSARSASAAAEELEDDSLRRFSWAIGMEYPLEFGRLSRMSYLGIGLRNELQIPEWDFKSTIDTRPTGRLYLHKSPRNFFTCLAFYQLDYDFGTEKCYQCYVTRESCKTELKRDMVDNDKRLKSDMTNHRIIMQKKSQKLERGSTVSRTTNTGVPLTVMDAETLISEQYVVCRRCNKTYKESRNTDTSCRYHHGPIIAVFGGMCQNCGMLDYTDGCVVGFHTRKKRQALPSETKRVTNRSPIKGKPKKLPEMIEDEGIQV